ncbi:hypothetical protein [Sabulicella glaciei]|uniref:Uncharacterized protein n=1 Tax=Sabulicella glaciei TaxID=2984948 RepID=A0ABT3NUC7_9PROT|nr:hypothetical protein [Roseococcus sp. MDT2-1-1]MCW8085768.1 hypothetical protein [Roseococcus sp. MDT2-1-1]
MGGLFRAPKPLVIEAPPPLAAAAAPAPAPAPDMVAEDARQAARSRATGGMAGTVATSSRGVLLPLSVTRKSLLGE